MIKGGLLGERVVSAAEVDALSKVAPREQLMAEFAGAMESILADFAGLLDAKLREFVYAMDELADKGVLAPGEAGTDAASDETEAVADAAADAASDGPEAVADAAADAGNDETEAGADAAADAGNRRDRGGGRRCCRRDRDRHGGRLNMTTKEEILDAISNMTVLEFKELLDEFKERFDVTAAAPVAAVAAVAAPADGGGGGDEEQSEFDVILAAAGDKKIQVIKEVRALTNLGLKDAKDLVDNAPKPILEKASKEDAEKAKELIEAAGGTVELK